MMQRNRFRKLEGSRQLRATLAGQGRDRPLPAAPIRRDGPPVMQSVRALNTAAQAGPAFRTVGNQTRGEPAFRSAGAFAAASPGITATGRRAYPKGMSRFGQQTLPLAIGSQQVVGILTGRPLGTR